MNIAQAQALGFGAMISRAAGQVPTAQPPRPVFGWTAPTVIYEEQRLIDQDARRLDASVQANVPAGAPFKDTWNAWYANWKTFFAKYQTSDAAKAGAVFYTDDLARTTESYRAQLAGLYAQYGQQRQPSGAAVPAIPPPSAQPFTPGQDSVPGAPKEPSLLPWWGWMLLGVGTVGLVYWGYRRYQDAQRFKGALREEILPHLIGPGLAKRAPDAALPRFAGDPEPLPHVRRLSDLANDPRAYGMVYRPYVHPHLVPGPAGDARPRFVPLQGMRARDESDYDDDSSDDYADDYGDDE